MDPLQMVMAESPGQESRENYLVHQKKMKSWEEKRKRNYREKGPQILLPDACVWPGRGLEVSEKSRQFIYCSLSSLF